MPTNNAFREKSAGGDIGIGVDIVSGCNLRCVHCYYDKLDHNLPKIMPFSLIENLIGQAKGIFSELYLLGGEPTLHPQIYEIIKYAMKHMRMVVLVTNGLEFVNAEFCKQCAEFGATLSMHRWAIRPQGADIVDQLSRKKGAFEKTSKAWGNVQKLWKGDVCAQINLLRPLIENGHAMDVFQWAREQGYKPIMEMIKASDYFQRNSNLDLSVQEAYEFFCEMREFDRINYPELAPKAIVPPVYGNPCTLIETGIHVLIDGTAILWGHT